MCTSSFVGGNKQKLAQNSTKVAQIVKITKQPNKQKQPNSINKGKNSPDSDKKVPHKFGSVVFTIGPGVNRFSKKFSVYTRVTTYRQTDRRKCDLNSAAYYVTLASNTSPRE